MPKYTRPKRTWRYSNEFKIRAVKMSHSPDIQSKQVADGLGIHPLMLSRWRKLYREGKLHGDNIGRAGLSKTKKPASSKELSKIARLKKENERLKKENDLLKKWQRYLAEQHQNDLDSSKDTEN